MAKYLVNILISIDQFAAVVFLGGDPDETISSRLGKVKRANRGHIPWKYGLGVPRLVDNFLNWVDPGHSTDAIEDDEGKDGLR